MRSSRSTRAGGDALPDRLFSALNGQLPTLLVILAAALILWPLNGAQRDYDEGVYWQSLRSMASGHALFTSVFSSQPPYFLLSIYPFYRLFGESIVAARFGIGVFAVVGVIAMYWLGRELGGHWVGLVAAALLTIDPLFLHEARTLQAEAPALALEILSVALAVAAMRRAGRTRALLALACGVALGLGTLTKLLDVVALVPIILYLAQPIFVASYDAAKRRIQRPADATLRSAARTTLAALGWVALGSVISCAATLAPFVSSFGALWSQVVTFHLVAAQVESASLAHNAKIIAGGMKTLGVPALLALALAYWRRSWAVIPPLLWLLASAAFLVRQNPLFDHHIVLVIPCLALLAALGVTLLPTLTRAQATRWPAIGFSAALAICFLIGAGLGVRSAVSDASGPDADTAQAAAAIAAFTTPDQFIVTDDQYTAALADRSVPPSLVDTSSVRIATQYLTAAQLESMLSQPNTRFVVLRTGRLQQVPGFMPWLDANYTKLVNLAGGGAIYERAPTTLPIA